MILKDSMLRRRWKKRGVKLSEGSRIESPTEIGEGTRVNGPISIKGKGACTIGRHCALGADVKIITSNHLIDFANVQCSLQRRIGARELDEARGPVVIGNNVWIGDSAIILTGVSIGDGALIGAGAVVTRDIPDFGVCAGVPAKLLRRRFSDAICEQLKSIAWWHWDAAKIMRNRCFFDVDLAKAASDTRLADFLVE